MTQGSTGLTRTVQTSPPPNILKRYLGRIEDVARDGSIPEKKMNRPNIEKGVRNRKEVELEMQRYYRIFEGRLTSDLH